MPTGIDLFSQNNRITHNPNAGLKVDPTNYYASGPDGSSEMFASAFTSLLQLITDAPQLAVDLINALLGWLTDAPELFSQLVNAFIGFFTDIPSLATDLINGFISWFNAAPQLLESLINAVISLISDLPELITNLIGSAITWITDIEDLATTVINAVLQWITEIPSLIPVVINAALSWITESETLITTVINAVMSWVTALPSLTISVVNTVLQWITEIPELIASVIDALLQWVASAPEIITQVINGVLEWVASSELLIETVINDVLGWVTAAPGLIITTINTFLDWVTNDVSGLAATIINTVLTWISASEMIIQDIVNTFLGLMTEIPTLIITTINTILGWITDDSTNSLGNSIIQAALGWITSIPNLALNVVDTVLTWITDLPDLATIVINSALQWLEDIPTLATTVINAVLGWIKTIPEVATSIINAIVQWALEIPDFITGFINAMMGWVTDVPNLLTTVVNTALGWIDGDTTGLGGGIIQAALGWITAVPELITSVIDTVLSWINEAPDIATNIINAALQWVTEIPTLATTIINAFVQWVTEIPQLATALVNGFISWINLAPELIDTLLSAIITIASDLPNLVTTLINGVLGWVTNDTTGNLATSIVNAVIGWVQDIPTLIEAIINALITWVSNAPELIATVVNSVLQWVSDVPTLVTSVINAFLTWLDAAPELAGSILTAVVTLISRAPEIAQSIIQAMIVVVEDAPTLIYDVITAILTWLDSVTGLKLVQWADLLTGFFGGGTGFGGLLGSFTNSILGFGNANSALGNIGSGQVGSIENLLIDPLFGGGFGGADNWIVDSVGNAIATVVGGVQSVISNAVSILTGQTLNVSVNTSAAGLAPVSSPYLTSDPVTANVNLYADSGTPGVAGDLLASIPVATAGLDGGGGLVANWDDYVLSGSYVVPATVDGVVPATAAVQLEISDEINDGTVRFNVPDYSKPDLIPQSTVDRLPEDKQEIIDAAAGSTGATADDIASRLAGIAPATGVVDWNYTPDVRTLNDTVVTQLNGWDGTEYGHTDSAAALLSQRSGLVGASTAINTLTTTIAALRADVTALSPPAPTNVYWTDEFERAGLNLGTGWVQTFSGPGTTQVGTNGAQAGAGVSLLDNNNRYLTAQWCNTSGVILHSTTDYQDITQVFSTAPTLQPGPAGGYNDLLGCISDDRTSLVQFRIGASGGSSPYYWTLYYIVGGVAHLISSGNLSSSPTAMRLLCGDLPNTTTGWLKILADNTTLWSGTESSHNAGSSYRGMGFGYGITVSSGGVPGIGGLVDSWSGHDQ